MWYVSAFFKRIGLVVTCLLAFLKCAHVGSTVINFAEPKDNKCHLDIYTSPAEVKRGHEVLCLLDAKSGSTAFADRSIAGAISLAKPEACKCGGDAIIVVDGRSEGASLTGWGEGFTTVKVIRYLEVGH